MDIRSSARKGAKPFDFEHLLRQKNINDGQDIEEIRIKEDAELWIPYKKFEEWLLIPHSGEESVVISYGILNAKVQKNPLLNQKQRIFSFSTPFIKITGSGWLQTDTFLCSR